MQDRPAWNKKPGVRPVLQRRAGEPEAASAEVAVGDGRPLGLRTRLRPGGQTWASLQTPLQWTLMDRNGAFAHPDWHDFYRVKYIYLDLYLLYVSAAFTAQK